MNLFPQDWKDCVLCWKGLRCARLAARDFPCGLVGVPNAIARLAAANLQSTLAVSIHAGNQQLREQLIPRRASSLVRAQTPDPHHVLLWPRPHPDLIGGSKHDPGLSLTTWQNAFSFPSVNALQGRQNLRADSI